MYSVHGFMEEQYLFTYSIHYLPYFKYSYTMNEIKAVVSTCRDGDGP